MRKKILFLTTVFDIGGAEHALLKLLKNIKNFDTAAVALKGHGLLSQNFENLGIPIYYLRWDKPFNLFSAAKKFKQIIRKEKPDVLVTFLPHADFFGRIFGRIFGIKIIIPYLRSRLRGKKYLIIFILDRISSFLVTKYIAVSETIRNFYIKNLFISPKKIIVIPNGIVLPVRNPMPVKNPSQPPFTKGRRDRRVSTITIGTISRLRPEKGIIYLVKAMRYIIPKNPNIKLIIAGDGSERKKIEHFIKKFNLKNKIELLGFRNDTAKILDKIDIFVLPSLFEGMSNAILEAMAAGKAIIASNIPENRELIKNNKNGFLVQPKNSKKLATRILKLTENPILRKKLGRAAYKQARLFDIKTTVRRFEDFIATLF